MHIEILVEDSSGAKLIEILLPKIIGFQAAEHSWRIKHYKGIGRVPSGLSSKAADPAKRILLDQLRRLLSGYGNTPGVDAVIIVCDSDRRNCKEFLAELNAVLQQCSPAPNTLFRLAIEEMEAWFLGDRKALLNAYPRAKKDVLKRYIQDSVCDTWELLADAVHPGGLKEVKKSGFWLSGQLKHDWAEKIGPEMDVEHNQSPSFGKFRDGLRRVCGFGFPL